MIQGFRLLDEELGWERPDDWRPGEIGWEVLEVGLGLTTGFDLHVELSRNGSRVRVVFKKPVCFRVQDSSDIVHYWQACAAENAQGGTFYLIEKSAFLDELSMGISAIGAPLKHFLIAGETCVEVLGLTGPRIERLG
jgi:hypothetical protein